MHARDLFLIDSQGPPQPHDHRRDRVRRLRRVVVQQPDHVLLRDEHAELLVELAQRGLSRGLAWLRLPSRQRPLPSVSPEPCSATRQEQAMTAGWSTTAIATAVRRSANIGGVSAAEALQRLAHALARRRRKGRLQWVRRP